MRVKHEVRGRAKLNTEQHPQEALSLLCLVDVGHKKEVREL
jgi:hypothetical protein